MFDPRKTIAKRLADATDLLLDFATLGEYGLEPQGSGAPCEVRTRPVQAPTARRGPRRAVALK